MPQPPTTEPEKYIRLHKLVRAPRAEVYDAWLNPDAMSQWFAPDAGTRCTEVTINPKVGGQMRIVMEAPDGRHTGVAEFLELVPDQRIVYRWSWEEMPDFGANSTVTIELFDAPNPYDDAPATEIILTHEGLNSPRERSEHTGGWWTTLRAIGYFVRGINPRQAMYGQPTGAAS